VPGTGASLVSLLALTGAAVMASPLASVSTGDIRFGIDTALFDYTGGDTLGVEVYQEIQVDQLSMDNDSMAGFETLIVLTTAGGDTTALDQWYSEVQWTEGRTVVNSTVLPVAPGDYVLHVTVTDGGNGMQGTVSRPLGVEPLQELSELELARVLVAAPEGSDNSLLKGGYLVYPAASGVFTLPSDHILYGYVEIYDTAGEIVRFRSRLESPSGEVIFARPWSEVLVPEGAGAIGMLDSLDLQAARSSGLHRMVFAMVVRGDTLEVEKLLIIGRSTEEMVAETGETMEEITGIPFPDEFRLLLSTEEEALFEDLDDEARTRFYASYWLGSAADRLAFEQRCLECVRYAGAFAEGWRTDRGRVYVIYGAPNDIEAMPLSIDQIPYEIWSYYGSGANNSFVFADRSGTGDYEQIFSTVEGETSYSNWEDMLSPLSTGANFNGDSSQP
jgi:GWxTD domain-containing protein